MALYKNISYSLEKEKVAFLKSSMKASAILISSFLFNFMFITFFLLIDIVFRIRWDFLSVFLIIFIILFIWIDVVSYYRRIDYNLKLFKKRTGVDWNEIKN